MAIESFAGRQHEAFVDALTFAFRSYDDLRLMARIEMNLQLNDVSDRGPLRLVVSNLIEWAEAEGCLEELIGAALRHKPRSPKLKAFSYELLLNATALPSERLEAIVMPQVPMQDTVQWRAAMERLEGGVCRIEMPAGSAAGTGSLIADDLVLTNSHVARELGRRGAAPSGCAARFGFRLSQDGAPATGEAIPFADDWLVDESPVEELDYAVIRLAAAPDRPRLPPPAPYDYREGDIYLILQHPSGEELKISAGVFDRYDAPRRRISYTANTMPGSSGSPVFTLGWAPVALHHAGSTSRNTGVVLTAVMDHGKVAKLWRP